MFITIEKVWAFPNTIPTQINTNWLLWINWRINPLLFLAVAEKIEKNGGAQEAPSPFAFIGFYNFVLKSLKLELKRPTINKIKKYIAPSVDNHPGILNQLCRPLLKYTLRNDVGICLHGSMTIQNATVLNPGESDESSSCRQIANKRPTINPLINIKRFIHWWSAVTTCFTINSLMQFMINPLTDVRLIHWCDLRFIHSMIYV